MESKQHPVEISVVRQQEGQRQKCWQIPALSLSLSYMAVLPGTVHCVCQLGTCAWAK